MLTDYAHLSPNQSWRGSMRLAVLVALVLIGFVPHQRLAAQPNAAALEAAVKKLAGQDSREWVFQRMEVNMGSENRCNSGETWEFTANRTVKVTRCVEHKIVKETKTWSIAQDGIDTIVTIGGERHYLTFRDASNAHFMRLRIVSDSKVTPRIDKEFRLRQD